MSCHYNKSPCCKNLFEYLFLETQKGIEEIIFKTYNNWSTKRLKFFVLNLDITWSIRSKNVFNYWLNLLCFLNDFNIFYFQMLVSYIPSWIHAWNLVSDFSFSWSLFIAGLCWGLDVDINKFTLRLNIAQTCYTSFAIVECLAYSS